MLENPSDTSVVPYTVTFENRVVQLALGASKPLINHALENYAHRNLNGCFFIFYVSCC